MQAADAPPVNLADHERRARERLSPGADAYFNGGAADEHTLRANQAAWSRLMLWPRVLCAPGTPALTTTLLGRDWPTPVLVAPMAQQGRLHPDAERATALAAAAQGVGMVLSMQANTPLEHIAHDVDADPERGPLWFQLYHLGDRGWTLELAERAARAGYEALVLTVDAPIQGVRDRERRAAVSESSPLPQPHMPPASGAAQGLASLLQQAASWADVEWLRAHSPLPLLLKGILHPADARVACEAGVAGIVVSNHGGRVLDTTPPTADVLPHIVEAVRDEIPLLVDGGIRRGTDVFKALALGARAVLLGRPVAHGLVNGGARGVAHVLRLLLDEFSATMALCGLDRVSAITPRYLYPNPTPSINLNEINSRL